MEKYLKYAIISLVLASFIAKTVLVFANEGLWWDEAVYLGLGRNIPEGYYSLDSEGPVETYRPPIFPLLISPLPQNVAYVRIGVIALSALAVVITYWLSKKIAGKDAALWASLFLSTNQLFVFFSGKVLSEPLFMIFLSSSLLLLLKGGKANLFLSGLFSGLAFLTRYIGTIFLIPYMLYFLFLMYKRRNAESFINTAIFVLGVFLAVSPSLLLSYFYYGNMLASFQIYAQTTLNSVDVVSQLLDNAAGLLQLFSLQIFFVIGGLLLLSKETKNMPGNEKNWFMLLLFIFPLFFAFISSVAGPRFLLSFLPLYALLAGVSLAKSSLKASRIKYVRIIALAVCFYCLLSGVWMTWSDRFAANGLAEASLYLKSVTKENDTIMSASYPYVYYLAERKAAAFPAKPDDVIAYARQNSIRYVIVYKFEPENPAYLEEYFANSSAFITVKRFGQWGDENAAVIYVFKG
jgi:4-amino-4-deoxy-L-arabinose transferase-like glycosyltransferase